MFPKRGSSRRWRRRRIAFADDPTNRDVSFTRPRLRKLMPALAAEGGDARNLARLASRLARANAAVEILADGAERYLALKGGQFARGEFDAKAFAAMPDEIRLRLLLRAIDRFGHEGPAELGKVEALLAALDRAAAARTVRPPAETDACGCAGQSDRRPDPHRAGAAPPPPDPLNGPDYHPSTGLFSRLFAWLFTWGVLTTPGRARISPPLFERELR